MTRIILQLFAATFLMIHFLGVTNGSFYTDTVKRSHPGSKLPSAKEYSKNDKLGQKEEAENRKVIEIEHSSEEKFGQPDLKSIKVLPCNTTKNLTKAGEWFRIQSKGFGDAKGNYFPGEYCYWKFTGVKIFCIPEIKCDKVDLRSVDDERLTIYDRRTGKMVLFGADHFHELKKAHDHKGLIVQFHASPSEKRKRHFDGFMCLVTCNRECADELDANTCPYSLVDPHKPPPVCPDPIKTHDCEHESTTIHLLSEPKADCKQEIVIPLKEGSNKTKIEIEITLRKDSKPDQLDFYILYELSGYNYQLVLSKLPNIIKEVKALGKDSYIGFGAYSDKADPAVARAAAKRTFSFSHYVDLTSANNVIGSVSSALVDTEKYNIQSTNIIQESEDALTALHQLASCQYIGWRKGSRKVVLIMTYDGFHLYSDKAKKLGYEDFDPNKCYDSKFENPGHVFYGNYTNYPNPADVVKKLKQTGISILLNLIYHPDVTAKVKKQWENYILIPIKPNYALEILDRDSADVTNLIRQTKNILTAEEAYLRFEGRNTSSEHLHFHSAVASQNKAELLKCGPPTTSNGTRTTKCIFEAELSSCPRRRGSNRLEETMQVFLQGYSKPIATFYFDLYCNHESGFGLHG